ncbi:MAG: sulfotransferase [Phycisphaerales bacterium]
MSKTFGKQKAAPSTLQITRQRANQTLDAGEFPTAIALANDALKIDPNDADMLYVLGWGLVQNGALQPGAIKLRQAIGRDPSHIKTLCALAEFHRITSEPEKGIEYADRAIALTESIRPLSIKVACLASLGRYQEAADLLAPRAKKEDAELTAVVAYSDLADALGHAEEGIELIQKALEKPIFNKGARNGALYILGRLLDKVGRYDEAFDAFQRANNMNKPGPRFEIDGIKSLWTREAIQNAKKCRFSSDRPVLVVGMPRSGTTLTERIIAAHPKGAGVGEQTLLLEVAKVDPAQLTQAMVDAGGKRYLDMLDRLGGKSALRVVDKMPDNYQVLCIAACMIPGARVIHCLRDPRDTCLSCYFQNFGVRHLYTTDLAEVAYRYVVHLNLMKHWREATDLPILELKYEELVADPETQVRRMLDFLGLPFDERCLEFHRSKKLVATASRDQVRQPLYKTSVARWERYKDHIGPMLDVLREGGAITD